MLPFENLGSAEDDYFADGIADEIRGKLTSLRGLLVIARGSSTPYKKTTKTPQQIAEELNASYLLNATVRWDKSGGKSRVHVSPELVDVTDPQTPASKWQQPFDAALTDVFQVQSDIASRAAQELGVVLGVGEEKRLSEKPTQNLAAYDAFLKGEETSNAMAANDPPSVRKALASYEQAVALDPALRAGVGQSLTGQLDLVRQRRSHARARGACPSGGGESGRARARPAGAATWHSASTNGSSAMTPTAPWSSSGRGSSVAPGNADLLTGTARAEQALGRWDAAVEHFKEAERSDPRSAITLRRLGTALLLLRRYPEAREALDRGLAIAPTDLSMIEGKAMTFLGEGNLAGARQVLGAAPPGVEPEALVVYAGKLLRSRVGPRRTAARGSSSPDAERIRQRPRQLGQCSRRRRRPEGRRAEPFAFMPRRRGKPSTSRFAPRPRNRGATSSLGLALAYLGRKEEAIQEGERGVALSPISKDAVSGPYYQHQLVRIYMSWASRRRRSTSSSRS